MILYNLIDLNDSSEFKVVMQIIAYFQTSMNPGKLKREFKLTGIRESRGRSSLRIFYTLRVGNRWDRLGIGGTSWE